MTNKILPLSFYESDDVVKISQALLGKVLVTHINGQRSAGIIVETEAYRAPEDKASHAYNNRCTQRTKTMFNRGGVAYIYLCYGIHHLFNVVTASEGTPHAVLIRAIQPIEGIDLMLKRRKMTQQNAQLCSGPGKLTQALGISRHMDGVSLLQSPICIEEGKRIKPNQIDSGPRIGVDYAEEFRDINWRFWIKDNPWVSRVSQRDIKNQSKDKP